MIVLGTRPADDAHWFQRMLDGGADYAQAHAAGPKDKPFQRRTWVKANPSLYAMPDLERAIRKESIDAKKDPSMATMFESLRLNKGTADVLENNLLDAGTWQRIEGNAPVDGAVYFGIDLGTSAAQSAVAAFWPNSGRLDVVSAFPNEPDLATRGLRDGVGSLYVNAARRGELIPIRRDATVYER